MSENLTRENAIYVSNTIFGEICVSVEMFNEYLLTIKDDRIENHQTNINLRLNVVLSVIALSCYKFIEFNKKYGQLLNKIIPQYNDRRKKLVADITNRNILEFRNEIVGHIHSQKLKRPLTLSEYQKRFDEVTGGMSQLNDFFNWLRPANLDHISKGYSVCGEIKKIQEALNLVSCKE